MNFLLAIFKVQLAFHAFEPFLSDAIFAYYEAVFHSVKNNKMPVNVIYATFI